MTPLYKEEIERGLLDKGEIEVDRFIIGDMEVAPFFNEGL